MKKFDIVWTPFAKTQLDQVYDYIKEVKKSPQGALNVKRDIIKAAGSITFTEQYQQDDILPDCRRVIVRHYKIIYKEIDDHIVILQVFDTKQDPSKLIKES